jgi:hypothetical protein
MMIPVYPDLFSGALFICGANALTLTTPETINPLADIPMVFLTGTGDFNLDDTRYAISTFQQAGLNNVQLSIVAGLDHALPAEADLDMALGFLNGNNNG